MSGRSGNMNQNNTYTYTCANCFGIFESDRPDDEALGEALLKFGYYPKEEMEAVCDDCYKILTSQ